MLEQNNVNLTNESKHPVLGDCSFYLPISRSSDNLFSVGSDGVEAIYTPLDKKVEFIVFKEKVLCIVKSEMKYPAIYPMRQASFEPKAQAVLMDLDGTSVRSEHFWMWIIEQTIAKLLDNKKFTLHPEDEPYVSGHSVSEHLQYCINKYCPDKMLTEAREHYFEITNFQMQEILKGRGRPDAFVPSPGLKEFLLELKANNIKIGPVTSGLYEKAWPEIISAFNKLNMGDPLDFYDAIISAGYAIKKGQVGTLGELEPKPHPWLYAETACVGLGFAPSENHKIIGIEDSGAGVVSIRLAGFAAIGISGGNIEKSGTSPLLWDKCDNLLDALPAILGK